MDLTRQAQTVLGLDIGRINTRASLFGIVDGKYRLLGGGIAPTTVDGDRHLGEGVGEALENLQINCGRKLLRPDGGLIMPVNPDGEGLDRIALTCSAGPPLKTVALGLTQGGSLAAARALIGSLPLALSGCIGLADLGDEPLVIDRLLQLRPKVVVLTGGENAGAEQHVRTLIEITRTACMLLPDEIRPLILYAGNTFLREAVERRLEPWSPVQITANLQPAHGSFDLVPAQSILDRFILQIWEKEIPGLKELIHLAGGHCSTRDFAMNRMVRFLSRTSNGEHAIEKLRGVLAVDLGGGSTTLAVGLGGDAQTLTQPAWDFLPGEVQEQGLLPVHRWMSEQVELDLVADYLHNHALHPAIIPGTAMELILSQALSRFRLQNAVTNLAECYPSFSFDPDQGLDGDFEPVIASGAMLTQAPTAGQSMLMLLDGLQPRGVTTMVLDRYHILPLLGVIGETLPILPVQILETDAFQNLGTVIIPVSPAPEGEQILSMQVIKETGGDFSINVAQGTLRRLVLQVNEPAVLVLKPGPETDVGFGGPGIGGRLKVTGGVLGLVVDARGRPLPDEEEQRVALMQRWLWTLGG
jgi:hypothetical protein